MEKQFFGQKFMRSKLIKNPCLIGFFFFLSCGSEVESIEEPSEEENQVENLNGTDTIATVDVNESIIEEEVINFSYEELKADIDKGLWIKKEYLGEESEYNIRGQLIYHTILRETDKYLFINTSSHCDAGVECYYLITFSREDGMMISNVDIGQAYEAGSPDKFGWISDDEFRLSSYTYNFIEDEEGFYYQGELKDSVVTYYTLSLDGEMEEK